MGLFGSNKWECNRCESTYKSTPSKCSECGHTVLTQFRGEDTQSTKTPSSQTTAEPDPQKVVWYCEKCKQQHTDEPEQCKVCGTERFKTVGDKSPGDSGAEQYTRPDDDVETISNVREATSSPPQPESEDRTHWFYAGLLLLLLLGLAFYAL